MSNIDQTVSGELWCACWCLEYIWENHHVVAAIHYVLLLLLQRRPQCTLPVGLWPDVQELGRTADVGCRPWGEETVLFGKNKNKTKRLDDTGKFFSWRYNFSNYHWFNDEECYVIYSCFFVAFQYIKGLQIENQNWQPQFCHLCHYNFCSQFLQPSPPGGSQTTSGGGDMEALEVESLISGITSVTLPEGLTEAEAKEVYNNYNFQHQYDEKLSITKYGEQVRFPYNFLQFYNIFNVIVLGHHWFG